MQTKGGCELRHLREVESRTRRLEEASGLWRVLGAAGLAGALLVTAVSPASAAGSAGLKREPSVAVRITAVAGGLYHSLALSSNGAVFAWGWNVTGQLCNGNTKGSDLPLRVGLLSGKKVTGIAAGFAHSLAVTSTGAVFNCGKNDDGELGDGGTQTATYR